MAGEARTGPGEGRLGNLAGWLYALAGESGVQEQRIRLAAGAAQRQRPAVCNRGRAWVIVAGGMVDQVGDLSRADRTRDTRNLMRAIRQKHADVIACRFARKDVQLVLGQDLPAQVAPTNRRWPHEHLFPILWYSYQVRLQVELRLPSVSALPRATPLPPPSLRLKARGFHQPRKRH